MKDEENKRLAAALGDDYEARRTLAKLIRQLENAIARNEVLEEELADVYEELFRLQDRVNRGAFVYREEEIDLSDYCERSAKEDSRRQKLSEVGAERNSQLELISRATKNA